MYVTPKKKLEISKSYVKTRWDVGSLLGFENSSQLPDVLYYHNEDIHVRSSVKNKKSILEKHLYMEKKGSFYVIVLVRISISRVLFLLLNMTW